jgi:hypothetical protein
MKKIQTPAQRRASIYNWTRGMIISSALGRLQYMKFQYPKLIEYIDIAMVALLNLDAHLQDEFTKSKK